MQGLWLVSLASPSLEGGRTVACHRSRRRSWHIFLHSLRRARRLFLRRFKTIFFTPIHMHMHMHMHMPIAKANQHHLAMQTVSPVLLLQHIHPAPGASRQNFGGKDGGGWPAAIGGGGRGRHVSRPDWRELFDRDAAAATRPWRACSSCQPVRSFVRSSRLHRHTTCKDAWMDHQCVLDLGVVVDGRCAA